MNRDDKKEVWNTIPLTPPKKHHWVEIEHKDVPSSNTPTKTSTFQVLYKYFQRKFL